MSIFAEKKTGAVSLGEAADAIKAKLASHDIAVDDKASNTLVSMEAANLGDTTAMRATGMNVSKELQAIFGDVSPESAALPHQIEAATIAIIGGKAANKYNAKALNTNVLALEGATTIMPTVSGPAGTMDVSFKDVALEAFNNQDFSVVAAYSAAWNFGATRQDSYAEGFYPTVVQTPEQNAILHKVNRIRVFSGAKRTLSADPHKWNFKNVLEAYRDSSILSAPSTDLIPHVQADNSNLDKFVAASLVAPRSVEVAGVTYNTAPLKVGVGVDLLAVCQNPASVEGTFDQTDQINGAIALSAVYVQVTDGGGADVGVIKYTTGNMKSFEFFKKPSGDANEMTLSASTAELNVDKNTRSPAGAVLAALDALSATDTQFKLKVDMAGSVHVQTGATNIVGVVSVVEAYDAVTKQKLALTDAGVAALLADLRFTVVGYDLAARRENTNRRTAGLLGDRDFKVDQYPIPVGAPISIQMPVSEENESAALDDLVGMTRISNSIRAVTAQLNYLAALKQFAAANAHLTVAGAESSVNLEGIGRWLVTPHYAEVSLDLFAQVQSLRSLDRVADLNAVLLNTIRELAYTAAIKSNLLPALQQYTNGADEKPLLKLGTDLNLVQYLMISGDPRSVGPGFDFEVYSTPDTRLSNKIIGTFSRKAPTAGDPLSSGNHYWIPELVTVGQTSKGGATVKQLSVQPRNVHVHNLPVWFVINVTNLDKAIAALKPIATKETV